MCPPTLPHNMGPNVDVRDLITVDCNAPKIWLDWILIKCVCVCWVPHSAYTQVIWAWLRIARKNYKSTKRKKKYRERERVITFLCGKNMDWKIRIYIDWPLSDETSTSLMDLNTCHLSPRWLCSNQFCSCILLNHCKLSS